jgi:hypothetical protein
MNFDLTNEQYWAAQDPRVQALRTMLTPTGAPDEGSRAALCRQLFDLGFNPDLWIWVKGCDARTMMIGRASVGITWLPNMFSSTVFTYADVGKPAEARAVKISAESPDYKPFVPPPDPMQPPSGYVGAENGGMFLAINVHVIGGGWLFDEGDPLPGGHNGQALYFHFAYSPMVGMQAVWTADKTPIL